MRAAIYTRVSRGNEGEETSTGIQEEKCRALCELKDWPVAEVFTDVGISGFKKVRRPGYEAMLAAAEAGRFDVVVIYKLDRLTRQTRQLLDVVDVLQDTGVGLVSVNDPGIDTTSPIGRLVLTIIGAVAQLEAETIRLRTKDGHQARARRGEAHYGGARPFGWDDDRLALHPEEAPALRDVVERYAGGEGLKVLARWLNDEGFTTSAGKPFTPNRLARIMKQPRLIGMREHRGAVYESAIEPLIDMETWEQVQRRGGGQVEVRDGIVLKVGGDRKWRTNDVTLLSGFLVCHCGEKMIYSGPQKHSYFCTSPNCSTRVNANLAEKVVVPQVTNLLAGLETMRGEGKQRIAKAKAQIDEIEAKLRRLREVFVLEGDVPADEYRALREPLVQELDRLKASIAAEEETRTRVVPAKGKQTLDQWWKGASVTERRQALDRVVEGIVVLPADEVRAELDSRRAGWPVGNRWEVLTRNRLKVNWRQGV